LEASRLASGEWIMGFLCEEIGLKDAPEITNMGGWRAYLASIYLHLRAQAAKHTNQRRAKIYFRAAIDSLASIALESNRDERR
jgi:allophanate hydrolase-like protein